MEIRDATDDDASAIRQVHEASIRGLGPEAYDDRQVEAWATGCASADYAASIDEDGNEFVVAEDDGTILGFGSLSHDASGYPIEVDAEVTAVYVAPSVARNGVGTAILDEVETRARARGAERLVLTASKNAVSFYQRHGYVRHRSIQHEFSPGASTGVTGTVVEMVKPLSVQRAN